LTQEKSIHAKKIESQIFRIKKVSYQPCFCNWLRKQVYAFVDV